jgi:hexosaminidase
MSPLTPVRAAHLDLKGLPPTADRLVELLRVISAARFNAALVEWEDSFPWTADERYRGETAYTKEEVERFHAVAAERGIEVIPLVQTLGHMETPLRLPENAHLREVPHRSDTLNPLAPGAGELVAAMVEDVLRMAPDARYFHLGGDEAWSFGTHPETKKFIEEHGAGDLYLRHVEPLLDLLIERGVRPLLWHDMMRDWDEGSLRRLSEKADLVVWGYGEHPDETPHHYNSRVIERFKDGGLDLWGATAFKGADGHNSDLPDPENRRANALAWAEVAGRYGFSGLVSTGWSRYSSDRVQVEPIDAALDCLVESGLILESGEAPDGERVREVLRESGELERSERCREVMRVLSEARRDGWRSVQFLREQLAVSAADGRRSGSGMEVATLGWLQAAMSRADEAAAEALEVFEGLVEQVWMDRYLIERVEPLREELAALEERVGRLDPEGYVALEEGGA